MTILEVVIVMARCINLVGLAVVAGSAFFKLLLAPREWGNTTDAVSFARWSKQLSLTALIISGLCLILWVPLQFASLSDAGNWAELSTIIPSALTNTGFGVAATSRGVLTIVVLLILLFAQQTRSSQLAILLLTVTGIILQIRMGHAAAAEDYWLPVMAAIHLVAASLWFGSLPLLYLLVRLSTNQGLSAARRFSRYGIVFVLSLAFGAVVAGWILVGSLAGLIGTNYGNLILIKSGLFATMLFIAALNRFYFSVKHASGKGLRAALIVETAIGLAVFAAAALLATQPPAIHSDALWPFNYRLNDAIWSDAFLRDIAWRSTQPLLIALLIGTVGLFNPKWRWPLFAVAICAGIVLFQPIRINLFLQKANQASFLRSPTGYTSTAIFRGATAFEANCTSCHGSDGRGRGALATGDPVWPPDLTAPLFASQSDGELYWTIAHGRVLTDGRPSMPGFVESLDDKAIWSLVDYIRTIAAARTINLPNPDGQVAPARLPQFSTQCTSGQYILGQKTSSSWLIETKAEQLVAYKITPSGEAELCTVPDKTATSALALLTAAATHDALFIDVNGWVRYRWKETLALTQQHLATAYKTSTDNPVLSATGSHHSN